MKKQGKWNLLPFGVLLLAAAGAALRQQLYAVGLDEKNLLVEGHPLEWMLWLCTALAAAGICFFTLREKQMYSQKRWLSALGHVLAAFGILLTVLTGVETVYSPITAIWRYTGIAAAPLLLYGGLSLALGKRPFFGVYVLASVFFALHLICHYQSWCADPQLQNYFFPFAASLCLMLFGYYHAAAALENKKTVGLQISGFLAAYFCLVSVSGGEDLLLYLSSGIWAFTSLSPAQKEGETDGTS